MTPEAALREAAEDAADWIATSASNEHAEAEDIVHALRAALGATPSPALDVDRLGQAIVKGGIDLYQPRGGGKWVSANDAAAIIAREYAALSEPDR